MFSFLKRKKSPKGDVKVVTQVEDFNDVLPIAEYFHNQTGITFDSQISILKSKVISFCRAREIYSFLELLSEVKVDASIKQELIDYLTTNETFFYRELKQIQELVSLVKTTNSNVQILCAPCATGEEPYSIAIALLEAGVSESSIKIVGIDINLDAITKAQVAIYKERNIRNLSKEILAKYFHKDDLNYVLSEKIKSLVTFKVVNIFDEEFKRMNKFDFIFSRNMLIYFDKETKIKAKSILESMRKNNEHEIFFGHADLF